MNSSQLLRALLGRIRRLLTMGRASEWWEYKLLPAIGIGYAVSLALGASPWAGLSGLGWAIVSLVPGAVFVSLLNDLTDLADDAAAGKANRQAGRNPLLAVALIALCLAAGLVLAWTWRDDPLLVASYALGWTAYTLYSLPPFRFKHRGLAGVLCDAIGANVVPALLCAQLSARALEQQLPAAMAGIIAIWSLMFGLRGILWHQIGDLAADRMAGAQTYVALHGADRAARIASRIVFPVEVLSLAAIAVMAGPLVQVAGAVAAVLYAGLLHERIYRFEMCVVVVVPRERSCIALHEYYDVFLPVALLVLGLFRDPAVLAVLGLHLILFPVRIRQIASDVRKMFDPRYIRRPYRS